MDSWDYYFDNNERYQKDMLADEYRMVLRKAHKSISAFKGQVELVIKTQNDENAGQETNTKSVRATKPVPKRQLVFVPVTPTIEVKNNPRSESRHGGRFAVGEGHGNTIFAVPKEPEVRGSGKR